MSKNVTKLISPRVLCTSVTNRVLCRLDRFTPHYNCMSKNVKKLVSPWVLCTNVTNRVLRWIDRLTVFYYCMSKNVTNSYLQEFCAQVSQIVFFAVLTVLRLITTVWGKMSQNSSPRVLCTIVTNCVFSWITVLRLIRTLWAKVSQNSYLR